MKFQLLALLAVQVIVGCLVSASSSEAFLPSSSTHGLVNHARAAAAQSSSSSVAATTPRSSSASTATSTSSPSSPTSASGYVYQEADVRLYQSSTTFDSSSSSMSSSSAVSGPSTEPIQQKLQNIAQKPLVQAVASSSLFVMMNMIIQQFFRSQSITFPSSLAGCMALATSLLVTPNHASIYKVLSPGAKLLQKFLMVFLVPNLIVLPLCDGCGSITEVAKVFSIIFGGFLFSLFSTAGSVVAIRQLSRSGTSIASMSDAEVPTAVAPAAPSAPKPKAFSDELVARTRYTAIASGLLAIVANTLGNSAATPLLTASMLASTVHNFCMGARWPKKVTKVLHPLVTCTVLTWVWAALLGTATSTTFLDMIRSYRVGGAMSLATSGAGDVLTFLLGPAVVSLGVSIYERRQLIQQNWKEVVTSTGISVVGGLFGTAAMVRVLSIASAELRLSLLPRNITSALAAAIAEIVGTNKSLAVSFAVITGLIGANWGASLLNAFGIKDPVARGLGIGSAAHGLGTAAFVDEKDAFPFAAISMALTAIFGTVFVSIPAVKRLAIQIALGGSIPV
mmetsp:Transcript_10761/g.25641  ORF Transcript_10761/g.25641 Transcript_10761/m.25641 type:complete len:565 (+) Transcript_10761:201-1895(+)